MREKKRNMHFGCLIVSFESLMNITNKVSCLGSLIAFIGVNNLFEVKNCIEWTCEWNMRSRESFDSEIIFIRQSYYSLCYFEPRYVSLGLKPLILAQFRMVSAAYIRKGQSHSSICHHQGLSLFNLIYLIVVDFTFI